MRNPGLRYARFNSAVAISRSAGKGTKKSRVAATGALSYVAAEMPAHSGEPIWEWRDKVQAWEAGWLKEAESWLPAAGGGAGHPSGQRPGGS